MGYRMDLKDADRMFAKLQEEYEIWVSKRLASKGRYSDTDLIRYTRVDRVERIEYKEKPDFPVREVLSPATQSLFYFAEDEPTESKTASKKLLIFMRPCDTHAQHHQERMYLTNGGYEDIYYKRMSGKVKIAVTERGKGWDTCFCVSMGTSRTDDYSMVVRFGENVLEFQAKDDAFASYSKGIEKCPSKPRFVEKNKLALTAPEIPDKEVLTRLKGRPMWRQFDGRYISCGAYTVACNTCTCFTTTDIIYNEDRNVGERRRTSVSCQVEDFTNMIGGTSFRNRAGGGMCYKMLHKSHDYETRFKDYHMRVGYGRCTDRRPGYISIVATVNKMTDVVTEIKADRQAQEGGRSHEQYSEASGM